MTAHVWYHCVAVLMELFIPPLLSRTNRLKADLAERLKSAADPEWRISIT